MRSALYTGVLIVLAFAICVAWSSGAGAARTQHEDVGPIAGTVVAPDTERGVVVKAGPSASDRSLGYLKPGTRVQNYLDFKNGWVRVRTPFHGAWIQASQIEPQSAPAVVASVDQPENCLKVRDGPGSEYDVVGCLADGDTLTLTGNWTEDNWAQVSAPVEGWVYAGQIRTSLAPSYQPRPVPVRRTSAVSYPVSYEEPIIADTDIYDYDYYTDYAYPLASYVYGGYPWWWWTRFHNRKFYGKHFKHFWKSRDWDRRNWRVNTGRSAVAAIGRRGLYPRVGVNRGGTSVSALGRRGRTRVGVNRSGVGVSTLGRRGLYPRAGVNRGGASVSSFGRRGGVSVGVNRSGGVRFGSASRIGGARMSIGRSSFGGSSRIGGARMSVGRSSFGGRVGGMSMRMGGGGGRGGFRR